MSRSASCLFAAAGLALALVASSTSAQSLTTQQVATGLSQPVAFVRQPGSANRMFIVEQTGALRLFDLATNTIGPTYINLGPTGLALTQANGERGFLGFAPHPAFATNGFFYVSYTRTSDGASVLARYRAQAPFATSTSYDPATPAVILRTYFQPFANHNGGHIEFGPDGRLYWGMGDGGSANDPNELAQNINSPLGKMLRFNVDNVAGNFRATDNPSGTPGSPNAAWLDDVWSMGLRNPWRFSFDRSTGDLWMADVGQDAFEEIDFQPALTGSNINSVGSRNYGWDCREGFVNGPADSNCTLEGTFTNPIFVEAHSAGACSITGGFVYRGSAIPGLQSRFIYADYCGNFVRSFLFNGVNVSGQVDHSAALGNPTGLVAFGQDDAGELYMVSINGSITKIVPPACGCPCILTPADAQTFSDNFQTNLNWTATVAGATSGQWQRGTPVNDAGWEYDPAADSDGSGQCFLTQNAAGNTDVDGGSVILTSPPLNFLTAGGGNSGGNITICYDYYNFLTNDGEGTDGIFVDVSSNGTTGPWIRVASHTASKGLLWTPHAITQAQLTAAGVTNTTNMRIRYTASDLGTPSIVECGLDSFKVYRNIPITDCNNNGVPDATDIANSSSADCNSNSIPDECDISSGLLEDFDGGPVGIAVAGSSFFGTSCFGCHAADGTGGTGPNVRNVSREQIRRRLTLEVAHPGGGFPGSNLQTWADIEAYLADAGSRGRPDRIADVCQVLPNCDNDAANDGKELEQGTQIDADYDGIPDTCETCPADIDGDGDVDSDDIVVFFQTWEAGERDYDGDGDTDSDDIVGFFTNWETGC